MDLIFESLQCIQTAVYNKIDMSATSTVAAGWTATRNKLFAPEGDNAVATVPSSNEDLCLIKKHR
jgi:hypothetical protein